MQRCLFRPGKEKKRPDGRSTSVKDEKQARGRECDVREEPVSCFFYKLYLTSMEKWCIIRRETESPFPVRRSERRVQLRATDFEPTAGMKKKSIFGVLVPILVLAGYTVFGLGKLTIADHQFYAEQANNTHFTNKTITAGRGAIYDANGEPLAWSATVYKVYIDPKNYQSEMDTIEEIMKSRQAKLDAGEQIDEDTIVITRSELEAQIVDLLSEKLQITPEAVTNAMQMNTQYYILKSQVDKSTADELMAFFDKFGMTSITTEEDSKRYYPQNELAAQVIGFTNSDGVGQYGLEKEYNDYLSGVNGRVTTAKDGLGNTMPYRNSQTYEAQDGSSLYLTLDSTLQYYLEKNLQEMCETHKVENRSCGIIMNAKTGAIYAMATYPTFDLNKPSEIYDAATADALLALPEEEYEEAYVAAREEQWKNKAVIEPYIPGSVFKIFTSSAAVEEKAVDLQNDSFYCSGSYTIPGAEPIHCHLVSGHGTQTFSEALTHSCNPAFIEVGQKLGSYKFSRYMSAFGLRELTGIDLPFEANSFTFSEEQMTPINLATSSFGQGNKVTAIQMITGIAAAINGGYLVEPHLVSRIVSSDGNIIKTFGTTTKRQVISEETSATMRQLLQEVVDDNPDSNSHIDGYAIGGKSGTGEKLDEYKGDNMRHVASYTCFAPANDPEIVMLIMADEPMGESYYGSVVCAPYARNIMEEALPYLGYYPEYTEEEYAKLDVTVPLLMDSELTKAQETLDALGLHYEVKGDGETVTGQCPMTGDSIAAGGTIVLYTEENYVAEKIEVPDLTGYTASDANAALTNRHLNYVAVGASSERARVQSQTPAAGTMVDVGTVIRLEYIVNENIG